ncbi:MAG: hypothetical protein IKB98_08720 [Clostridia bacterium]|nr:hypothetical protein [Clostridia bacterium]
MNVVFGVFSIILGTFIGYKMSEKYVKRKCFYNDLFAFNQVLKTEVSFSHNSIKKIIKERKTNVVTDYLNEAILKENTNLNVSFLNEEENAFLQSYVKSIGKSDRESQLEILSVYEMKIKKKLDFADEEFKKYKKLYPKLGFLIGLIILVVLL